jgi:hypothetical protein
VGELTITLCRSLLGGKTTIVEVHQIKEMGYERYLITQTEEP